MPQSPGHPRSALMARLFPRRTRPEGLLLSLVGVFLIFMPVGFQMEMLQGEPLSWTRGVCNAVLAGLISVGWCLIGIYRMWWLSPFIVIGQFFLFPLAFNIGARSGLYDAGVWLPRRGMTILMVVLSITALSGGFALLMRSMIFAFRRSQSARAELEIARMVHESIVPPIAMKMAGLEILARSRASSTMGGDLIDVVRRDEGGGEVDLFLADVSGHGVKAGIVMAMLKASVRTRLGAGGPLGEILQDVNRVLADLTDPSMFATLACVRVCAGGRVEYALAGHLPILHVVSDGQVRELPNESLPLGIEPGERYVTGQTTAMPGDLLVLMTDGLMEVQGRDGQQLGLRALIEAVREGSGAALDQQYERIMARVDAHGAQMDDQTLALVRIG